MLGREEWAGLRVEVDGQGRASYKSGRVGCRPGWYQDATVPAWLPGGVNTRITRLLVPGSNVVEDAYMTLCTPATPTAAGLADFDATPALSPPSPPSLSTAGLITLLVGVFLPMTDFFIVNVALPTVDADLHASAGMLQLVVAGYAIAYAVLLVVGGRLGDAIGRRRLFTLGIAGFTLTSLACGLAPSPGLLVAARALQGAASAVMLPQVLSSIQATTTGNARNRALGFYGATAGIAVVAGQLLGGVLVSANIAGTGWRPIFLVNVPVGLVGMVMAARTIPETRAPAPAPVDGPGTVLLAATLLALLVTLTEGRSLGWPAWFVGLASLALVLSTGWPHPSPWALAPATLLCGIGQGLIMPPLFRIVLSEVPAALAGVGSGVLTTMQQTALGLGVATLGSIYLSESPVSHLGSLDTSLVVLGVLGAIAIVVGFATRTLPRDVAAPAPSPAASPAVGLAEAGVQFAAGDGDPSTGPRYLALKKSMPK